MNGWLVVLSCTMDDFPLRMFNTQREAKNFTKELDPETVDIPFELDPSSPFCIKLMKFVNGLPKKIILAREFDS